MNGTLHLVFLSAPVKQVTERNFGIRSEGGLTPILEDLFHQRSKNFRSSNTTCKLRLQSPLFRQVGVSLVALPIDIDRENRYHRWLVSTLGRRGMMMPKLLINER
jgi:hypothetical protein